MKVTINTSSRLVEMKEEIRTRYADQLAIIASPYSREERETWFTQLKEADDWISGITLVPMLTALAAARGIPVGLLAAKIKENDTLFRGVIGTLLGRQQAELDKLKGM